MVHKNNLSLMLVVAIAAVILMFGFAVFEQPTLTGSVTDSQVKRMLIKPHSTTDANKIKSMVDVRHEFDGKFSADVPLNLLSKIESMADIVDVREFEYLFKSVCGDGIIHSSEECGEPGLPGCEAGKICADCKCKKGEPGRNCFPSQPIPWNVEKVNGGSGGDGIKVAVLDSGIYKYHLDLDSKVCKDTSQKGIRNGCDDHVGHGTFVSGIIAANGGEDGQGLFGVAPDVELWMIKVCGPDDCYGDDIAEGIKYAARRGADIISFSLGTYAPDEVVEEAVDYAASKGVLFVAAAGNAGPGLDTMAYPAANPNAVAVGAIYKNEAVPSWSSRGINDGDYIIEDREIEFAAPGVGVYSTWTNGCYYSWSGTSMSAPHVAGLAAKLWQGNAEDTRTYLHQIARDIYTPGDDPATGFGLVVAP